MIKFLITFFYYFLICAISYIVGLDPDRVPSDSLTYIQLCPDTPFSFEKFSVFCLVYNYNLYLTINLICLSLFTWFIFYSSALEGMRTRIWICLSISPVFFFIQFPTKEPLYIVAFIFLLSRPINLKTTLISSILISLPRFQLILLPFAVWLRGKIEIVKISIIREFAFFSIFAYFFIILSGFELKNFDGSRIEFYNDYFYSTLINHPYLAPLSALLYYLYLIISWIRWTNDTFSGSFETIIAFGLFGTIFHLKGILINDNRRFLFLAIIFSSLLSGHLHFRYAIPIILLINNMDKLYFNFLIIPLIYLYMYMFYLLAV
jgi:hypothetical protein